MMRRYFFVRKERIPARGLKRYGDLLRAVVDNLCQKRTNPREGIETLFAISIAVSFASGQKRTNPREGIETDRQWWG